MTGMEIVELDWRIRIGGMRLADCFAIRLFCVEEREIAVDWTLKWRGDARKSKRSEKCTSQQKVDTTLYFYTSFNEHNTPYTVLESDNSESMPDVLH